MDRLETEGQRRILKQQEDYLEYLQKNPEEPEKETQESLPQERREGNDEHISRARPSADETNQTLTPLETALFERLK